MIRHRYLVIGLSLRFLIILKVHSESVFNLFWGIPNNLFDSMMMLLLLCIDISFIDRNIEAMFDLRNEISLRLKCRFSKFLYFKLFYIFLLILVCNTMLIFIFASKYVFINIFYYLLFYLAYSIFLCKFKDNDYFLNIMTIVCLIAFRQICIA